MSRLTHHKKITAIAVVAVLMAAAGAYAYWTQAGAGSGSATTGTTTALTIAQTSTVSALAPGAAPQALSGTISNPNAGVVHVTSVTATILPAGLPSGCVAGDFQINSPVATVNADVTTGTPVTWSGPTIQMLNTGISQDACKTASVTVSYTSI